ncbi:MAG: valine--tRNA ligase [Candidatus Pacebacteria bacterium]|nr:valine--tRNA ligase [Candidatus Paceibacterota bacterium]MCF7863003.1 valine--tRNA ligase [Candidatus Paceibacterota bacterium]
MEEKIKKPYDASSTEPQILKKWDESGFFNPDVCIEKGVTSKDAPVFSMVLPPPNVTGTLHTGHALMLITQDIMTRYARMQGKRTLWLPGTDHAAIATQIKVEKELSKKGIKKSDLSREEFLKKIEDYALESHDTIVNQSKKMGASLDWSREAFTLDAQRNKAVNTVFKKMYDDGLIYRGHRIINWDPKGQTVISDDEIVYEERKAKLYTFKYSADFPIPISTTRPETKFGDTAVAVHPEDERYQEYVGKEYDTVFCGEPIHIKIIADREVEKDFGTGALGVTPAHSMIDWELAQRHDLPTKIVINEYAKMTVGGEKILGKKTEEAREAVVEWLRSQNLLLKEEEITQNVSTAERTGAIIEPLPKLQWFVDVNKKIPDRQNKNLKELMLEPIAQKKINIIPDRFEKVYFNWVQNLRDWCISRQIIYGHRIPVWYKKNTEEILVCPESTPNEEWEQDLDTLDTWFSSGLWTFSTLGWPDNTEDMRTYHPTTMLETAHDIIFFWVARMILFSQYVLEEIPFQNVYFHGIVRTKDGKKMSKSLGDQAIDPLDIIGKYGNDALRLAMIIGNTPGNDLKLNEDDIRGYAKFANKIWNASRFVLENTNDIDSSDLQKLKENLDTEDSASMQELEQLIQSITKEMDEYRFSLVAEKTYHYFWHTFADILIERSKKKIQENKNSDSAKALLYLQLHSLLKVLHPFTPFITEEVWSIINTKNGKHAEEDLLLVQKWPI